MLPFNPSSISANEWVVWLTQETEGWVR
jgi:hypothetical protein